MKVVACGGRVCPDASGMALAHGPAGGRRCDAVRAAGMGLIPCCSGDINVGMLVCTESEGGMARVVAGCMAISAAVVGWPVLRGCGTNTGPFCFARRASVSGDKDTEPVAMVQGCWDADVLGMLDCLT